MDHGRTVQFLRKHSLLLLIITIAPLLAAAFLYTSAHQVISEADELERARQQEAVRIDAAVKTIQAKKAADAKHLADQKAAADTAKASAQVKSVADTAPLAARTCNTALSHADATQLDVIVNKRHCIIPLGFSPADLTLVYGATLTTEAAAQFGALYEAAADAGVPLRVTSSFRSYDNQIATYQYWVGVNGQAGADTVSARPGYSEHQTGLVLDLAAGDCSLTCFAGTAQYAWLRTNAANFGFVERYPAGSTAVTGYSPEAWHYRYVGVQTAQDMHAKAIVTLEEYWGVSGGDYPS